MNKITVKNIKSATIHVVGNKSKEEGISFASSLTDLSASETFIRKLIENSFGTVDRKHFTYLERLELNPVYDFTSKIFDDNDSIIQQSVHLATHLYNQSLHPNIKSGEFFVILIDCELDGETSEALVMLKSEHKDPFLTTDNDGERISVRTLYGTSIKNLDKGCLILNQKREEGYIVLTVDRTNNGNDAHYWTESFLHVEDYEDDFHKTKHIAEVCTSFITQMQKEEESNRTEIAMAARRNQELMEQDSQVIEVSNLPNMLFDNEEHKQKFQEFLSQYETKHHPLPQSFTPKPEAVKRKAMGRLNSIRLDNNFEIRILNSQAEIIRGYDEEKGMYFYQLWYKEEK